MANSISQGAIARIMTGTTGVSGFHPVVQIVSLKRMSNSGPDRWRLVLSDGQHYAQSMLATQQNEMISSGELREMGIVCLQDYIVNIVQNKSLIILLNVEVKSGPTDRIGDPINYVEDASAPKPQQTPQQQGNNNNNTGPYGGGSKPSGGQHGGPDVKPKVSNNYGAAAKTNPYGSPKQATNPYANRSGGGGSNSGPVQRQSQDSVYVPISALNPYQNRWTIKARVTKKGDMKTWSNARGEGNLFSVDLLDEDNSEIRGTFFKADADKWYESLQEGKVYSFCGGRIKVANKKFSTLNSEYEVTFDGNTQIVAINDDHRISNVTFSFVKLNEMESLEPGKTLDVIGVVKGFDDYSTLTTKTGKETGRRNLTLVDDTCTEITLTIWGDTAQGSEERWDGNPVIAFKSVKLSDYNGRSLSTVYASTIVDNPSDCPEAGELRTWFDAAGGGSSFKSVSTRGGGGGGSDEVAKRDISARHTLDSIRESGMGRGEKPDWAVVKATISFIKLDGDKDPWYTACPIPGCNKKVLESMEGGWSCEKCNQTHAECQRRYILSMTVADQTGKAWVTAFNDVALPLLNDKTADELHELKQAGEDAEYEEVFTEACFKTFLITMRIRVEMVNDEEKLKFTIQRMAPIDFKSESQALLDAISKYN